MADELSMEDERGFVFDVLIVDEPGEYELRRIPAGSTETRGSEDG